MSVIPIMIQKRTGKPARILLIENYACDVKENGSGP